MDSFLGWAKGPASNRASFEKSTHYKARQDGASEKEHGTGGQ
jgi:hypothetical protein